MRFRTLFKRFNSKKNDKKQPLSPKTTSPPSINTQVIDCPIIIPEQDSAIFSNFKEYNTNANTSISSLSYSLPTSFPPSLPIAIKPVKQDNTVTQLSDFNEDSISSSQVTSKSSLSLKDSSYNPLRDNSQENITKNKTIISENIDPSNDIINNKTSSKIPNIQSVFNISLNDDTVIPSPTLTPSPSHKSSNYDSLMSIKSNQENITKNEAIKNKNMNSSNDIINNKIFSKVSKTKTVSSINSIDETVMSLPTPTPPSSHKSQNYDSLMSIKSNQENITKNETIKDKNINSSNDIINNKILSKVSKTQTDSSINSNDETVMSLPTPTPPSSHKSLNYDSLKSNQENIMKNETKNDNFSNDIISNKVLTNVPNIQTTQKMHSNSNDNPVITYSLNTNVNSIASPELSKTSGPKTLTSHKDNISNRGVDNIIRSLNNTNVPELKVKQLEKEIGNLQIHKNINNHNPGNALHSNNSNSNNTIKNKLEVNISPQEKLGTIAFDNYTRQKLYDSPSSPANLALTSQYSSSPLPSSKKKGHNIFSYLFSKDKKKNKELKTIYQHFSVMDTQSIQHDGLVMVEKQDNVIHDLWEQRNSDLNKRNNELYKNTSDRNLNQFKVQPSVQFSSLPRMYSERDRKVLSNSPGSDSPIALSITRPPRSPKYSLNCPERRRSYVNPEDYPMAYSPKSLNNLYFSSPKKSNDNKNFISMSNSIKSEFTDTFTNSNSNSNSNLKLNSSGVMNNRVKLGSLERHNPLNRQNTFTNYNIQSSNNINREINSKGIPAANINSPIYIEPVVKSPTYTSTSTSNSPSYTNLIVKSSLLTSNLQQFSPPKFEIRNESFKSNLHIDSDISTSSPKIARKINYHSPVSCKPSPQEFLSSPLTKSDSSPISPKEARKSPSIISSKISPTVSPKSYISKNDDNVKETIISNVLPTQSNKEEEAISNDEEIKTEEKNENEIDESSHMPTQDSSKFNLNEISQSSSSSSDSESLENSTKHIVKSVNEDIKGVATETSIKNPANNIIEESFKSSTQNQNEEYIKSPVQNLNEESMKTSIQNLNEEFIKPLTENPNEDVSSRSNDTSSIDDELSNTNNDSYNNSVESTSKILNKINSSVDEKETTSKKESQEEEIIEEPLNQEEAIKYNIFNMKPIKIVQESKPIQKNNININKTILLRQMSSGVLKNKDSNSILKKKNSFGIIKNKSINPFIFEEIASFPIKFDQNPSNQLKNKLSIDSKKSKVSFCESKNEYRDIAIQKKSSSNINVNIKRISASSSMAPYIVEKSLNQTTILSESSIKFDNYNTTESFSILKGNFNDESTDPNIEYSDSEIIKLDSPIVATFDHEIPSISSINISYDTEMNEEQNNINTFENHHIINNGNESSATFYHNGKTNSFEEAINKRSSSPILPNENINNNDDNDEIINFFENHSDNKTSSFIVFDKDDNLSKEDSLFEKETTQDNSSKTVIKDSNFSKLRNVIETSNNTKNSDIYESEYTQNYPSSSTTNDINSNYTLYFNNFYI